MDHWFRGLWSHDNSFSFIRKVLTMFCLLLEVSPSIMFSVNVPKYLWEESVLTGTYLINWLPTRVLNYSHLLSVLQNCLAITYSYSYYFGSFKPNTFRSWYSIPLEKEPELVLNIPLPNIYLMKNFLINIEPSLKKFHSLFQGTIKKHWVIRIGKW